MRRESSTVVALVGEVHEALLAEVARSPNVSVVRPGPTTDTDAAAGALRQAARRMSPFVLVAADPLAHVAAAWQAMWDLSAGPLAAAEFEERAAEALAAWHAGRFELPDYYLVLTRATPAPPGAGEGPAAAPGPGVPAAGGLYLGPLRAARPHRVEVVVIGDSADTGPAFPAGAMAGPPAGPRAPAGPPAGAGGPSAPPAGAHGAAAPPASAGGAAAPRAGAGGAAVPRAPAATGAAEQAARVMHALRSLRHGPWWPPLGDLVGAARTFYPGVLAGGRPGGPP